MTPSRDERSARGEIVRPVRQIPEAAAHRDTPRLQDGAQFSRAVTERVGGFLVELAAADLETLYEPG